MAYIPLSQAREKLGLKSTTDSGSGYVSLEQARTKLLTANKAKPITKPTIAKPTISKPITQLKPTVASTLLNLTNVTQISKTPIIGQVLQYAKQTAEDVGTTFTAPFKQISATIKMRLDTKGRKELDAIEKSKLSEDEKIKKVNKLAEKYGGLTPKQQESGQRGAEFGAGLTSVGANVALGAVQGNVIFILKKGTGDIFEGVSKLIGKKAPQEILNTVIGSSIEKTPQGKALIKTALQAEKQGKNVEIKPFEKLVEKPPKPKIEPKKAEPIVKTEVKAKQPITKEPQSLGGGKSVANERITDIGKYTNLTKEASKYKSEEDFITAVTGKRNSAQEAEYKALESEITLYQKMAKQMVNSGKTVPQSIKDKALKAMDKRAEITKSIQQAGKEFRIEFRKTTGADNIGRNQFENIEKDLRNFYQKTVNQSLGGVKPLVGGKSGGVGETGKLNNPPYTFQEWLDKSNKARGEGLNAYDNPSVQFDGYVNSLEKQGYRVVGNPNEGIKVSPLPQPQSLGGVKVKPKKVSVPPEKLQSRVFERLQKDHPEQLKGELPYDQAVLKTEFNKAAERIVKDKQKAYEVAMGRQSAGDLESVTTNIELAERALAEGNNTLYEKLVRNRSIAQTRRGQAIVAEKASIEDNSTARYVKDLISARLDNLGKKYLSGLKEGGTIRKHATEIIDRKVEALTVKIQRGKIDVKTAFKLLDELACV